jgi:replication-associated recombination protein RarA
MQVEVDKGRGRDLKTLQYSCMFYGNPGTGKTTVARMYARLLQELGVLPEKAPVVETSGASLLSAGLQDLKKKVEQEMEEGGVLFVDEAYQLKPNSNPMGAQVGGKSFSSWKWKSAMDFKGIP